MKVWIDQDLCTGDGLCVEITPDLFYMHSDGLAYVKDIETDGYTIIDGEKTPQFKMATGLATIPDNLLDSAIESAEECPGECIFIEV